MALGDFKVTVDGDPSSIDGGHCTFNYGICVDNIQFCWKTCNMEGTRMGMPIH